MKLCNKEIRQYFERTSNIKYRTWIVFMSPSRNRRTGKSVLLAQLLIKSLSPAPNLNSAWAVFNSALPKKLWIYEMNASRNLYWIHHIHQTETVIHAKNRNKINKPVKKYYESENMKVTNSIFPQIRLYFCCFADLLSSSFC